MCTTLYRLLIHTTVHYITPSALEAASLLGGEGLVPFYAMLEGGREGDFFSELEEHFYYAQIRT